MADADAAAAPAGVKLFVGNLPFKLRRDDLTQHFAEAGKVLSANVITRGSRSRGYGFVEMATHEEAEKAVAAFHHREIEGRPINVEIAKPRETKPAREPKVRKPRRRTPKEESEDKPAPAEGGDAASEGRPRRKFRTPRPRQPKREGKGPRVTSSDTLFVANIPFTSTDADLSAHFDKFKPVKAHVVLRRGGRSKGFGFVTFGNADSQKSALELNGSEMGGRPITVKVALNPEPKEEKDEAAE